MPLNRYSWGKALSTMIRTNKNIIYFYIKEMPFLDLKILVSSPAPAQPLVSKWTRMKKTAHHQTLQPMFSMTQIINGPIPKLWVLTPNIQRSHDFTNGKRKMERSRKISPISFSRTQSLHHIHALSTEDSTPTQHTIQSHHYFINFHIF